MIIVETKHFEILESTRGNQKFKIINDPELEGKVFEFLGEGLSNGVFWMWEHTLRWDSWDSDKKIDEIAKNKIIQYLKNDFPNSFEFE